MAGKLISEMGLPTSIANIFAARNILTAKDALLLNEFELMELLDVDLDAVKSSIAQISASVCPPYQTALQLMQERVDKEYLGGHFPTTLKGLDKALFGGIPFGALTELVGPAGIGKTQFCLKLSLLAALPTSCGGLNGHVIYVDTESKFSSRRLIEIGESCYPQIFHVKGMAKELAGRIVVLQPATLSEFAERLQQIKLSLLQNQVRLVIVDSIAALVSSDHERHVKAPRRDALGWHVSFLKSLAELSRVPIVVTNQVRALSTNHALSYSFQDRKSELARNRDISESHLIPALGMHWAHAVNVRLVLEAHSGQRFIKLAKSPISPPLSFPFIITSAGISLLNDDGMEVSGTEINSILNEGGVIVSAGEE
ncbi:DNA repair protein RAD51 homolog 2 isoform X2 [Nymphaea colorata]|uniref:DNA repair protein RAD51 homolog 2 isoform X2 n=1 Tax=Nymphaea colorata TaxID=210225 RepID=UPI00129E5588|nr:DNA repair protein RAD51 homolog 2 isoform X2 [Nymphaea colorata]